MRGGRPTLPSFGTLFQSSWVRVGTCVVSTDANSPAGDAKFSTPLSHCRELALQIVQDLPTSLLTRDTLPKMCHLVSDGSADVQRMAYQLLQEAAKKYTEELVVEAAVDTEDAVKSELPAELLDILQRTLNQEEGEEYGQVRWLSWPSLRLWLIVVPQDWFGYILAWMVTFDLFTGAVSPIIANPYFC